MCGLLHRGWRRLWGFELKGRYGPVGDAAGDDPVEVAKVGGDVECEAMRGDGLGDMHTDGRNLLFVNAAAGEGPDAGKLADALRGYGEVLAGQDECFFHQANKIDWSEMRSALAGQVAAEVEDGIADELPRAVVGNISAAIDLVDFDAAASQKIIVGKDVCARCIAAKRENRWVLKQNKRVSDDAGLACGHDLGLNAQAFRVGNAAELEKMDVHGCC